MDASSLEELLFDPSKCSKLSMEQKRELVYEVSNWSDSVAEILHTWSRQEILQILCAELGKERKYTGLTKSQIIDHLLKIISEKKAQERGSATVSESQTISENGERTSKRQRKPDHPNRLSVAANGVSGNMVYCKNSACKATLSRDDVFCKRCSCCICRQYDDNKDPSLWLICNSDPPFHGVSCGLSCHLECALRHENSGISKDKGLDGSFFCVSCGKVNDLLGSWRKQLVVARDTRRVDILGYRLSLCHKILSGTKHYQDLCRYVDEAVSKLEQEVGPLTGLPVKKARGIVNRLSSGVQIQGNCASAIESLDSMLSERVSDIPSDCSKLVRLEEISASSITLVLNSGDSNITNGLCCMIWHQKAGDKDYPVEPTCRLFAPNTKFLLSNLTPSTEYFLKAVILDRDREIGFVKFQFRTENETRKIVEVERSQSPATNCSSLSNPSSVEDENNNALPCSNEDENRGDNYLPFIAKTDKTDANECKGDEISLLDSEHSMGKAKQSDNEKETSTDNRSNKPQTGLECVPYVDTTPSNIDHEKDGRGRKKRQKNNGKDSIVILTKRDDEPQAGSSSKKMSGERREEECTGIGDKDFEYYIKVLRSLECEGHIETEFRQKFLTWYSLRATPQEVRVVKVFIDTFIEDPESLAEQLVDSFSDAISNKRCSTVPSGFCMKLWH